MKKISKKILGLLTILGLGRCVLSPQGIFPNTAHATSNTDNNITQTTTGIDKISFLQIIDLILKIIYILLWPLLVLAGMALDNSMVYGSFLHMDAPLWQFWNMTKNFANFALGFMVLIAILKTIFTVSDTKGPMDVIKKTLIAGILIQASWFLMAALVDVSTIATYAIGGMPMSILKSSSTINNKKILMTESSLDLNNIEKIKENDFEVRYTTKSMGKKQEIVLSPCKTQEINGETYIIGRKYGDEKFKNQNVSELSEENNPQQIRDSGRPTRNICIFGDRPYFFNEFPNTRKATSAKTYETILNDTINELGYASTTLEQCKFIINISSTTTNNNKDSCETLITALKGKSETKESAKNILDTFDATLLPKAIDQTQYGYGNGWLETTAATTIGEIIDKSKGFVGPLVTIYASLMDFASLPDSTINNVSMTKGIGDFIFRTGIAIGLFFPLLALAIVLFARIGFLWAIIATSPLVILAEVFKWDMLKKQINVTNIIKTIFAPVITVFALSISLIFMTTISDMLSFNSIHKIDVLSNMDIQKESKDNNDTYNILGQKIQIPKSVGLYVGATGDIFSRMIVCFAGIGMMRFILFAAIKASGTIGESIGEKVQTFGSNFMKTMPVIPTPLGNAGLGTLKDKFSEGNIETYRENKVVNMPKQKENMDTYLESKAPQFFKGDDFGKDNSFNQIEAEEIARRLAKGDIEGVNTYVDNQGLTSTSFNESSNINAIKSFGKEKLSPEEYKTMMKNLNIKTGGNESINTIKSEIVTLKSVDEANKELGIMLQEGKIFPEYIKEGFEITLGDTKKYTYSPKDNKLTEVKPTVSSTTT